ncbi:cyclic-di-AMP-binding protein CbpB [Lentilactobacillus sp. Marseille-Q4993]|uniref:cyclic-di-AMP-binding protein CbpB n=1 Tax=Lentilactobacillus sp. Marseille-Q4993 TaxID=3039492 RepID=UPI0024BC3DC3|nr:cyclic-di-AMP-binding protein CbpB [Lentilactobacillus sp. Marseille-Q4993]
MIDKPIENVLEHSGRDIVIDADLVATVNEDNNLAHVFLVLSKVRYAKIPVLDKHNHFKGLISLSMITQKMLDNQGITAAPLENISVKEVMQTDVNTVTDCHDWENILRQLEGENFLPFVDDSGVFKGIITRREIIKSMNYLTHNFAKHYVSIPAYEPNKAKLANSKNRK